MKFKKTERGFRRAEFLDRYSVSCSLQKSSLAGEDCIWLGVSENRMHITRKMAKKLIPELQRFVDTGDL